MSATLKFSISPLNPYVSLYNRVTREYDYLAYFFCWGVRIWSYPERLRDMYNQNFVVFHGGPYIASPASNYLPRWLSDYSCALMCFKTDATPPNQYLLKYYVTGRYGAKAAFYINGNLIASKLLDEVEPTEILVPCPDSYTWWYVYMFGEGSRYGHIQLRRIECYIAPP